MLMRSEIMLENFGWIFTIFHILTRKLLEESRKTSLTLGIF